MKLTASTGDGGGNGGVREVGQLTERWSAVLDRVGEQRIDGEADAGRIRVSGSASRCSPTLVCLLLVAMYRASQQSTVVFLDTLEHHATGWFE